MSAHRCHWLGCDAVVPAQGPEPGVPARGRGCRALDPPAARGGMSMLPGIDVRERNAALGQWYTPPALARRLAEWAHERSYYDRILEPSCGEGELIAALRETMVSDGALIVGLDIDPRNAAHVRKRFAHARNVSVLCTDFMAYWPPARFDLAVMNPPFEDGQTEAHIMRALQHCTRVVCHCPLTTLEGQKRKAALWDRVTLHRLVIHAQRPKYGPKGGATAMCTIDVALGRAHGAARPSVEWW